MEIVGYIPLQTTKVPTGVKLYLNKLYVEGKQTSVDNEYILTVSARCITKDTITSVDDESTTTEFERYNSITRGIKVTCNANLDILTNEAFQLIEYATGNVVDVAANTLAGSTIVNILETSDVEYGDLKTIIDTALDEIKKVNLPDIDWDNIFKRKGVDYADVYLDSDFSKLTDGEVKSKQEVSATGLTETIYYWEGKWPLDRLIYTIQSNLDILLKNQRIKGDVYGNLYATLMAQAINSATVLEQARIQAYEQASQFQIKSMLEYYLGVITAKLNIMKSLAEVQTQFLQKCIVKAQIKLYYIQSNGFKANNISKLFNAQLDGATTAFSAGMTETPPAVYNNAELMGLYTQVGSDMMLL